MIAQADQTQALPHAIESEYTVLGAALYSEEALAAAARVLRPDDFTRLAHRRIYTAALDLWRNGRTVDVLTVADALRGDADLGRVGGLEYLAELVDAAPTAAVIDTHVRLVAERATLRRIAAAAETVRADALEMGADPQVVLSDAHARLLTTHRETGQGYVRSADMIGDVLAVIEHERRTGEKPGVPTGIPHLDHMTGGLRPGDLVLLAARPSMGKTAIALQIGSHVARLGRRVLIASLEMSRQKLVRRQLVQTARMSIEYATQTPERLTKLSEAAGRVGALPVEIDDRPGETIDALRAGIHRAAANNPPSLVVVDYLQLLDAPGENRVQQVGRISRGLKLMASDLGCPVVALSQLSRAVEGRSPPRPALSDLRDSGTLEQDADVVLLLWRPEYYFDDKTPHEYRTKWMGRGELLIGKNRDGETGKVRLMWDAPTTTFTEEAR